MLITDIDKFIENQLNLLREYKFNKPIKKDISSFVSSYEKIINNINYSKIYDLINDDKNKKKITNIIEKYILFYLILRVCLKEDEENVESKNNEKLFVEKIFNLSNSLVILDSLAISELVDLYLSYYTSITLVKILDKNDSFLTLPQNDSTKEIINIFNDIGIDQIKIFIDPKKKDTLHNILIILLFRKLYVKSDKKEISIILESSSIEDAEFKYITIIESRIKETDFASLEALFSIEDRKTGIPDDYYNLIDDFKLVTLGDIEENLDPEYAIQSNLLSDDRKIAYLFHKKLLIPITDEILRYNITTEKYSQESSSKEIRESNATYKTDTKLNYIVNKVNLVTESARNPETKKLFYQPLFYRQAIPSNDIEEMKIIKKFADIGRVNAENVSSFIDLLSFRIYPYINFHNYAHYGFSHKHFYTTEALRYTNFRFSTKKNPELLKLVQNKYMQWRTITHDKFKTNNQHDFNSNIIGVAFPTYINYMPYDIRCLKLSKSINVRKYNPNGYKIGTFLLEKLINENKIFNKTPFWIFDINTDKFSHDHYDNINTSDPNYFKKLISKLYDKVEELTLNRILRMFEMYAPLTLYQSNEILNIITKKFVPIPIYSDKMAQINYARYFTYLPQRIETVDIRDITFSTEDLRKLPVYKKPKNLDYVVVEINKKELLIENILDIASCQHNIDLRDIERIRERDPTSFTKKLNEFYKRYVIDHINSDYICNSCNQNINIDKYIYQVNDLMKISAESKVPLEEQRQYNKFGKAINALDKIIERMGSFFNLTEYMGNHPASVIKRRETIRNLLDILLSSQDLRSKNPSEFDNDTRILKEASGAKYSEYFAFPVENDIFVYSSRDTDKFKRMKYNTILTHIAVIMLLDINNSSILTLNPDKLINVLIFEKYGLGTLDDLKLRINTSNDLVHLGNYLLMSYVIYYMASMMIRYKIYELAPSETIVDVKKGIPALDRLKIMHTIIHVLSIIIDRKVKKPDEYLYTILSTNYFIKLTTIFSSEKSEQTFKELKYVTEKRMHPSTEIVGKKLTSKKQIRYEIDGKLKPFELINNDIWIGENIFRRYFLIPKDTTITNIESDEINQIIKKDLLKMYRIGAVKLNVDILKLDSYSLDELYDIKKKYIELIRKNIQFQKDNLEKIKYKTKKKQEKLVNLFNNLQNELLPFNTILDGFINKLEKYISESQSIFKDDYYLRKSVFVINHDIAGYPVKPFNVDKITIKYGNQLSKNEQDKKDVIIYRENKTERYYDIYTLAYLGYKEVGATDFVEVKNNKFLIVKYSLIDKIKYLGLYKKYVNILPLDKQLTYENKFRGDILYNNEELVSQLIQNKISHDKILLEKFQRIIFSIRNKKQNKQESNLKEDIGNQLSLTKEAKLINEFNLRLQNISILSDSFVLFLQNWKNVFNSYKYIPDTIKLINNNNNNYIDSDSIIENNKYNVLIKYLLLELIQLIDMNNDKTNINLCSLIAMIFDLMWEEYAPVNNFELNKFLLILYSETDDVVSSSAGVEDTSDKISAEEFEKLSDDQKAVIKDAEDDFKEENEAVDVEGMDEDEKDLGEDSLAVMMHDPENADGF
jgi:hypothetical protein